MKVLLIAPQYDAEVAGESWSTYKWVQGISGRADVTVLTQHWSNWNPARSPVSAMEVINWTEPGIPGLNNRFMWELKATYPLFYFRARRWLRAAIRRGQRFDLVHQINPLALRYPCPARGLGLPYLIGPLAGSLPTPAGFRDAPSLMQWYRKLRHLDTFRLRHDPSLKQTYREAAAVIGVAPYVRELLQACPPLRFETMAETGVEEVCAEPKRTRAKDQPLRLLFVGRLIRTKGVLEAIESVAKVARVLPVTLDIIGSGDLQDQCHQLVSSLGVTALIRIHGRKPRSEVSEWYARSDVFLFPSYREPSGNVVFEALSQGLPVITSTIGGPGHVVTERCGIRIAPNKQDQYVAGIADAILALARDPDRVSALSAGAIRHMAETALWPRKIDRMIALYEDVLRRQATVAAA
jgi:glycosyltransferase involved in cell wall biosynthesis